MIEKGSERLDQELDIMNIIEEHKHHHKLLLEQTGNKSPTKDILDIDKDSDSDDFQQKSI